MVQAQFGRSRRGRPRRVRREGRRGTAHPATTVRFAASTAPSGALARERLQQTGAALIPIGTPHRPDTLYGLSKCFGEDLAQLYWDQHGLETVSLRIGSCFEEPASVRALSVWMSPGDGARLFHAALTAENVGHTIVYGSSADTRLWWDLSTARALGYAPQDDSEEYAAKLVAEQGELDPDRRDHAFPGGHFVTDPPVWPH